MEKDYRNWVKCKGLVSFQVQIKQTDLWISSEKNLEKEAKDLVFDARNQVETYIKANPEFLTSLVPWPRDNFAPPVVKDMVLASETLGVGPMACVAGAIAQYVGNGLLTMCTQVIVENGGDIFLKTEQDARIAIFAGNSPLSGKVGLIAKKAQMPLGVCSSSRTIGHSLSMGIADAVTIVAPTATFADGAATALGNQIKKRHDLDKIASHAARFEQIVGGVAIVKATMAAWGDIEIIPLR